MRSGNRAYEIMPKKGDLHEPKNWRAICLLDIASKMLVYRMQKVQEAEGLEAQSGSRGNRGTIDYIDFLVFALLCRRGRSTTSRHGHYLLIWLRLSTRCHGRHSLNNFQIGFKLYKKPNNWKHKPGGLLSISIALEDGIVFGVGSGFRNIVYTVLRNFGMPDHFINILTRLHTGATMKFKIGDIDTTVPSNIGVRQGSCERPTLFLFIIQVALETMTWPVAKPQLHHQGRSDHGLEVEQEAWRNCLRTVGFALRR